MTDILTENGFGVFLPISKNKSRYSKMKVGTKKTPPLYFTVQNNTRSGSGLFLCYTKETWQFTIGRR